MPHPQRTTTGFEHLRLVAAACLIAAVALVLAGCSDNATSPDSSRDAVNGNARAFDLWRPAATVTNECSADVHNAYSTVADDGKRYPTWHPPVDPVSGCSFGHEHGRDPHGSRLYALVGDLPFGYANEQLDQSGLGIHRHEDHVGHKIEWENDLLVELPGTASQLLQVRCDVMTKLHQGTHSRDAFTNNLHELNYHIRCNEGTEMHITMLSAIGRPGEFERTCGGTVVVGPATPVNSPAGGGQRKIPHVSCIQDRILRPLGTRSDFGALHESWETSNSIRAANGRTLASFNPYFQVFRPSRYFDPAAPDGVGRPLDLCYTVGPSGERAQGGECAVSTDSGRTLGVLWNEPRSVFNGARRQVDINDNNIDNANGPRVWYTDPFGRDARPEPFPGAIRQVIAQVRNNWGFDIQGPVIGGNRSYSGAGTRAPN
jgi:hypothetical protein